MKLKKIKLDSDRIKSISDLLKEEIPFIRSALDQTLELPTDSQAETIPQACDEFIKANSIEEKKAALRKWISMCSCQTQVVTVHDEIPKEDVYLEEKILAVNRTAEFYY